VRFIFLLCGIGLLAQTPPPPDNSGAWTLVDIKSDPVVPRFEYTIWNGVDHAYVAFSTEALPLRLNQKLKVALVERFFHIYIVDEAGEVYELRSPLRKDMVPPTKESGTQN
jgi:hypothetical protein